MGEGMKNRRGWLPVLAVALAGVALAVAKVRRPPVGARDVPQPRKPALLDRYLGLWYEIGRYDNRFERGLEGVTAEYRARADGALEVVNKGRKGGPDGPLNTARGVARVVPGSNNTKLKVSFFGPFFFGDYWVLDHADDYAWSIVGEPSGRYLWLLSRTPDPQARAALQDRARELGYDADRIHMTAQ
jgi:apolipoprotein D and lipocalin family protein